MAASLTKSFDQLFAQFKANVIHESVFRRIVLAVGTYYCLQKTLYALDFGYFHFFHRSRLWRYTSKDSWAIVTGASDGIGKGFAKELLSRGINVVLHGRNEQKLSRLKEELVRDWPERDIRILVLDASEVANINLKPIEGLNIRILVNNVGAAPRKLWTPLVAQTAEDIDLILNANTHFQTEITRQLLPRLVVNQPALILTVGSGASLFACPYIAAFSAAKAYGEALSHSLRLEMQVEGKDVEVLHLQVGMVQSGSAQRASSFLVPTSRNFARYALGMVGCGRESVWPYWPHAVQFGLIGNMPMWLRNRFITKIATEERALEAKT